MKKSITKTELAKVSGYSIKELNAMDSAEYTEVETECLNIMIENEIKQNGSIVAEDVEIETTQIVINKDTISQAGTKLKDNIVDFLGTKVGQEFISGLSESDKTKFINLPHSRQMQKIARLQRESKAQGTPEDRTNRREHLNLTKEEFSDIMAEFGEFSELMASVTNNKDIHAENKKSIVTTTKNRIYFDDNKRKCYLVASSKNTSIDQSAVGLIDEVRPFAVVVEEITPYTQFYCGAKLNSFHIWQYDLVSSLIEQNENLVQTQTLIKPSVNKQGQAVKYFNPKLEEMSVNDDLDIMIGFFESNEKGDHKIMILDLLDPLIADGFTETITNDIAEEL